MEYKAGGALAFTGAVVGAEVAAGSTLLLAGFVLLFFGGLLANRRLRKIH